MLVSATENIDETPSGVLVHGIMSSIASRRRDHHPRGLTGISAQWG